MNHRKVLQTQITLGASVAIASAVLIVAGPEIAIWLFWPVIQKAVPSLEFKTGVIMFVAFFPLALIAAMLYQRMMLTAALYATLLNIDENLEKLAKKSG